MAFVCASGSLRGRTGLATTVSIAKARPSPAISTHRLPSQSPRQSSVFRAVPRACVGETDPPQPQPQTTEEQQPLYAEPSAGEVGAPPVGQGLGPRRATKEKTVTKAAAAQGSMGFADAWASQNRDRGGNVVDVWVIIGALFLFTPFAIIAVAAYTGVIPTGGLFE